MGDEIMFTAPDPPAAAAIALGLAETFRDHPSVPPVRAGLARGQVLLRDGDAFGPVVNLAARVVNVARPGDVVTTVDVAAESGLAAAALGAPPLKGIADTVELYRLLPAPARPG